MFKEHLKTLLYVIKMRSIIGYNGLVYALKQTPVIGKILPDSLYRATILKVIYWMFHILKEIGKLFIGKIFGLSMVYLVALFLKTEYMEYNMAAGLSEKALFGDFALFIFLFYAVSGILVNIPIFRCTTEKEYLVFMLRMNARKLNNTLFVYDLAKLFAGYLMVGVVAAVFGAPVWVWLGIPFLAVFIKLFGAGARARVLRSKDRRHKPLRVSATGIAFRLLFIMMAAPIIFAVVINGLFVPLHYLFMVSGLLVLLGIWGALELNRFTSAHHRRALRDNIVRNEIEQQKHPDTTKQFKKLTVAGTVKGDKKGFDYLNALFVRRHRKMLITRPVVFTIITIAVMAFTILSVIMDYKEKFGVDCTKNMILHNLLNLLLFRRYEDTLLPFDDSSPYMFLRYLAQKHLLAMIIPVSCSDMTFKATQAMYINCDNSLMTFSFFKQRDKIIRLFDIRLRQLIKINAAPAVSYGLAADLVLFYTGGQDYPFHYLVTLIVPVLMSVVSSATGLAMYYLLQPFTTTVNVKSGAYILARGITGLFLVWLFWVPVNSLILAPVLAVFVCLEIVILRKIVFKKAPKTWRIKS